MYSLTYDLRSSRSWLAHVVDTTPPWIWDLYRKFEIITSPAPLGNILVLRLMDKSFVYSYFQTEMKYLFILVAIALVITMTTVTRVESKCGGLRFGIRINRCSKTNLNTRKKRPTKMTLKQDQKPKPWKKETEARLSCTLKVAFNREVSLLL